MQIKNVQQRSADFGTFDAGGERGIKGADLRRRRRRGRGGGGVSVDQQDKASLQKKLVSLGVMRFLVLVLVLVLVCRTSEGQVSCRNNNNVPVDWYILYKAPRMDVLTGQEYLYIDSQGEQKMLSSTPNYKPISHPTGVLANTLQHLFLPVRSMPLNHGFVLYSDQAPGCDAKQNFGHSKGILMIDKRGSGIWLLHSTPRFPYRRQQNNFWPSSANTNAQTFICVTFPYAQFQKIGKHLQYIQAFPYNYDIPDDFHQELQDAVNWQADSPAAPFYQELHSKANNVFYSFSKLTSTRPK
ncbi:hypothetical protein LDENG_00253020, partial [Lucifuga dentata]